MKTQNKLLLLITLTLSFAIANTVSANFSQNFENNTTGWSFATRVATGVDGVPSHTGGFYAQAPGPAQNCPASGQSAYTYWGGESTSFPGGGYTTYVWVYLDPEGTGANNDTRFDWTSAIYTPSCIHRRDFVFNFGFYTDTVPPGTGPRFVVSGDTVAGRCNSFPKNPGHDPFVITDTGWYKLEHQFNNLGGVLSVTMNLYDSSNTLLHSWTRSDPSDIIGTEVGGNGYGWFASQEFPFLAFDDSGLIGIQDYCNPPNTGPVATQGYWMNHPGQWCQEEITIGDVTYSKAEAIAKMQHATNRDMTYQMFAQLVAAELNVYCNHSDESCVIDAIQAADLWMADHHVGGGVRANSSAWQAITWAYNTLYNYNEGLLCAPHMP